MKRTKHVSLDPAAFVCILILLGWAPYYMHRSTRYEMEANNCRIALESEARTTAEACSVFDAHQMILERIDFNDTRNIMKHWRCSP